MNKAILIGRLAKEPSLRTTQSGQSVCDMSLAVTRKSNREEADFITIIAWNKTAENCAKYLVKGSQIAVVGEIRTRSYEGKNGKVYVTEVVADEVEFLGTPTKKEKVEDNPFGDLAVEVDDSLPF